MAYVDVPKDSTNIKTKFIRNFTKRQCRIIQELKKNLPITQWELASAIGKLERTVKTRTVVINGYVKIKMHNIMFVDNKKTYKVHKNIDILSLEEYDNCIYWGKFIEK